MTRAQQFKVPNYLVGRSYSFLLLNKQRFFPFHHVIQTILLKLQKQNSTENQAPAFPVREIALHAGQMLWDDTLVPCQDLSLLLA